MAREVKRSKNSNDLCSSDISSSLVSSDLCSLSTGFKGNDTKYVLTNTPEKQVFTIDWIREEILKYVIYDNETEISSDLFQTARLVQKSWLSTATKLLKKCENSLLIELTLGGDNVQDKRKLLHQFIGTFGVSTRLKESVIPFKLTLGSEFFRQENYQSLSDCFTRVGKEMLELEIVYPFDGGNMSVNFPSICLPILQKLSFQFSDIVYKPDGDLSPNFEDNKFGICLLQSIINAADDLQELVIPFAKADNVPVTFEFLQLPASIVFLELGIQLGSEAMETFFLKNQLPNLTRLLLQLHGKPFTNDLMYKILEQFRKTLVSLQFNGLFSTGSPLPRTHFRFPVMERLECLNINSTECELELDSHEPEQLTCLQKCLPQLDTIILTYQTEAMLKKWVDKSKFEGVSSLDVSIINELLSGEQDNYFRSPSLEIMTQLSIAFPNVNELAIHINIGDLNVLKCLFENMKMLEELRIEFHGKLERNCLNLLDSIIIGIPIKVVEALKESKLNLLETVLILTENRRKASICNLTELSCLTLGTNGDFGEAEEFSLISDLLFGQAFLKMRKLGCLYLDGKFEPSVSMLNKWEEQGRFIEYSST